MDSAVENEDIGPIIESIGDENASNLTGRDAATPMGIVVTYTALFAMALGPILVGSLRSVPYHSSMKKSGQEAADRIKMKDAAMFPVYASVGLFGLYLFFKFLPKEYVNLILSVFFLLLGVSALTRAFSAIIGPYLPSFITNQLTQYHILLTIQPPNEDKEECSVWFTTADIIMFIGAVVLGGMYFFTKQWVLNNVFGLAFSVNAVEMISLDSIKVGCMLLGGLFLYDIFWVFGTDVMVTVAKGLEAPIKLTFPMDLMEKGLSAGNFGMLGLGDIVIPGLYIALLCRFDFSLSKGQSRLYFYTSFVAYIIGLGSTIVVMHVFKAAQPALLYLVPSCLGIPFIVALVKGDIVDMFKYVDYPEKEDDEPSSKEKENMALTKKKEDVLLPKEEENVPLSPKEEENVQPKKEEPLIEKEWNASKEKEPSSQEHEESKKTQ